METVGLVAVDERKDAFDVVGSADRFNVAAAAVGHVDYSGEEQD